MTPNSLTSPKNGQIIAAGSLLGVMSLEGTGFPVGKVEILTMYPMTFYEFLEAVDNRFLPILKELDFQSISTFHDSIIELLKQYFYVGGMPAAVKQYSQTRNFTEKNLCRNVLCAYR